MSFEIEFLLIVFNEFFCHKDVTASPQMIKKDVETDD